MTIQAVVGPRETSATEVGKQTAQLLTLVIIAWSTKTASGAMAVAFGRLDTFASDNTSLQL